MKKIFNKKIQTRMFLIVFAYALFLFASGYRLTAMQAVNHSLDVKGDIKVFGEVRREWATVYLLETQDGIKSCLAEKRGFLWNCSTSTYFYDDIIKDDDVKTVGWVSYTGKENKQITVFAIRTNNPDINFIEVGLEQDRQKKPATADNTIIFSWDKSFFGNGIDAVALDKNNVRIYEYGYNPKNLTVCDDKDLRWYPITTN